MKIELERSIVYIGNEMAWHDLRFAAPRIHVWKNVAEHQWTTSDHRFAFYNHCGIRFVLTSKSFVLFAFWYLFIFYVLIGSDCPSCCSVVLVVWRKFNGLKWNESIWTVCFIACKGGLPICNNSLAFYLHSTNWFWYLFFENLRDFVIFKFRIAAFTQRLITFNHLCKMISLKLVIILDNQ